MTKDKGSECWRSSFVLYSIDLHRPIESTSQAARSDDREQMITELLYQTDAYLKEFTAHVTAAENNAVTLDRTAFYATGGQPHDTGTLSMGERTWQVTEVRKH